MRILYLGAGDIGAPTFRKLISSGHEVIGAVTQPDKPAGRKQEMRASIIKTIALDHGIPLFQPVRLRKPEALAPLKELAPDLIVVMAYGQILPRELLETPRLACLNLHASLLPRHRGASPIQAAILQGDRETGITVMYMAEGLDTGDMLLKRSTPIRRRETGGSLHDRLAEIAPEALFEALNLIERGQAPRTPQNEAEATYAGRLSKEDGLIAWTESHEMIDRRIRAMNPWPVAHTLLPGTEGARQLKIFSCIQIRKVTGSPGTVLRADRNGILAGAGTGAILIREVQLEGKRRMSAREFLQGNPIAAGTVLG